MTLRRRTEGGRPPALPGYGWTRDVRRRPRVHAHVHASGVRPSGRLAPPLEPSAARRAPPRKNRDDPSRRIPARRNSREYRPHRGHLRARRREGQMFDSSQGFELPSGDTVEPDVSFYRSSAGRRPRLRKTARSCASFRISSSRFCRPAPPKTVERRKQFTSKTVSASTGSSTGTPASSLRSRSRMAAVTAKSACLPSESGPLRSCSQALRSTSQRSFRRLALPLALHHSRDSAPA